MSQVFPGRYTAESDEPFVVFLIGMRINRIFVVRKWLPTAQAMTTMLRTLYAYPDKGFLGGQTILYWRGLGLIQYWRSFEDLERFARSPAEPHLFAAAARHVPAVGRRETARRRLGGENAPAVPSPVTPGVEL
jgi:hypothetical protein